MATKWYLEGYLEKSDQVHRVQINPFPFTIGRSDDVGFTVPSDNASRLHAEIILEYNQLKLIDHNSTNGTFVNRIQLYPNTSLALEHGDILHFADFEVRVLEQKDSKPVSLTDGDQKTVARIATLPEVLPSGYREMNQMIQDQLVSAAFQPIVDVKNNTIHAYEILGRGSHPELSPSPGVLFSKAESFLLAVELSELFRAKGMRLAASFNANQPFFLNIHPEEHKDNGRLLEQLSELRVKHPETDIVLELHEQVTSDIPELKKLKSALEALNIRFAYDDFGAGQTRLLELVEVPADYLKFDIGLVRDIHKATAAHREMVGVLVEQAQKAGTLTLAEGIEVAEDVHVCRDLGFDLVQGYYFGKPLEGDIQLQLLPQ